MTFINDQINTQLQGTQQQHSFSTKFFNPKIVIITSIGLTAIGILALGIVSLTSALLFPPLGAGLLIGAGGIFLSGATIYALYEILLKDCFHPHPPQVIPARPAKLSLLHAMRLFKNYDASLVASYEANEDLPSFLRQCAESFPMEVGAKTKLNQLIQVQTLIESKEGDLDQLTIFYQKEMEEGKTFHFFALFENEGRREYLLFGIKKEHEVDNEAFKSLIQAYKSYLHDSKPFPLDLIPREFFHPCKGFAHLFHSYLGKQEVTSAFKKIYKIHLLEKVLSDYPEWSEKEDFRAWVRASLLHLQKDLTTVEVSASFRKEWEKALLSFNTIQEKVLALPKIDKRVFGYDGSFPSLQLSNVTRTARLDYPGIDEVKAEPFKQNREILPPPKDYLTLQDKEGLKTLNQWHEYLFSLYKGEGTPLENIESQAVRFLLNLPATFNASCFSSEEKTAIASKIYACANLALTLHAVMGKVGLHPSRFLASLKSLHLLIVVIQTLQDSYFSKYTVDVGSLYDSLLDDYYDLGPYQKEIYRFLEKIESKGEGVDLISLNDTPGEKTAEKKLIELCHFKGEIPADSRAYMSKNEILRFQSDFEGKFFPETICLLRSLHLFIDAFIAPHYRLEFRKQIYKKRAEFKDYIEGLRRALMASSSEILTHKRLLSIDSTFTIHPLGVKFLSRRKDPRDRRVLYEEIGLPLSPYYYAFGGIKESEIRNRLAEGMLSNVTYPETDQDGKFGAEVKDEKHNGLPVSGLKQSQFNVYKEKFLFPNTSIEASRDLQKMASGSDNRASNALYTFSKYPYLLSLKEHGEDYKRVFRFLLFKRNLLIQELEFNREMASVTLKKFDELLATFEKTGDYHNWIFIYLAHADALSSLRKSTLDSHEREKMHQVHSKKLLKWINELERGASSFLKPHRNSLHLAYLQAAAILKDGSDIISIAKSLILAKSLIEGLLSKEPFRGQILFDFLLETLPNLVEVVEKDPSLLDEILSYRFKKEHHPRKWTSLSKGVYQSHSLMIDLNHFRFSKGSKLEGVLPREIQENEGFINLFGSEALKEIYEFTYVKTPHGKAWHVSIFSKGREYSLYLCQDNANFPLLYRKEKAHEWAQWARIKETSLKMPVDLKKGYLWEGKEFTVEDPQGNKLYELEFEGDHLTCLKRWVGHQNEVVLDPYHMRVFSRLDNTEGFIAYLKNNIPTITYLRGHAEYFWNEETKKWESALYKGYSLTDKSIDSWILKGTQEAETTLFSSTFENYHLLENSEGKAKLILPYVSYSRAGGKIDKNETKYALTLYPQFDLVSPWKKQNFLNFDLEFRGHLKSRRPQGFLYLSYTLFIQGKYGEALLYLQRSQAVWSLNNPDAKSQREQIKEWIFEWKDETPNGIAFKTRLLHQEHQLLSSTFPSTAKLQSYDANLLPSLLDNVEIYLKNESKVDPFLRLSEFEKVELIYLAPRATNWIRSKIGKNEASHFINDDIRKIYASNKTDDEVLYWSLAEEVKFLEGQVNKKIKERNNTLLEIKDYIPIPLIDISAWLIPVKENEAHQATQEKVKKTIDELHEIYGGNSLSDEMGRELASDLEKFAQKVEESFILNPEADLNQLGEDLRKLEERLFKEEKSLRKRILYQFIPLNLTSTEQVARKLKQQEANFNSALEKLRYAYGINNFSDLLESHCLSQEQIPYLKQAVHQYEVIRTDRKSISRKRAMLDRLRKDPQNSQLREDFSNLLQEWRRYDVSTHPYAHILLLLEDELNITARFSQIEHIDKLMTHPDAYIHEAMAGGKTTFLRNVFSAIEAERGYLAGVMTYAPLMTMHHQEYAEINQGALGSVAYPFYYNRNADHDISALQMMILYHLKAFVRNGRIDQTPQASISLNHTLSEMISSLKKSDSLTVAKLKPSILALQKLLTWRGRHLSFYSDEIDKIFDPTKDYNYSVGSAKVLQKEYYVPALVIVKLLWEEASLNGFLDALKNNAKDSALLKMPDEKFETYLRELASLCYDYFKLPFDKSTTLDYLTEVHQKNSKEQERIVLFYQEHISQCKELDKRLNAQILHSYIGVLLRGMKDKLVGTHFGRSKDGIFVKPFSFSAVCQESSQRSFVLSTILEICIDYLVSGVSLEGIKAYVEKIKAHASEELKEVSHLDETASATQFQKRFKVALSKIQDSDLQSIADEINNSYPLFEECLIEILLKNFTYYEEKIEGHAHLLPYLGKRFAGSSGSPERIKTLPKTIRRHAELVRQEGAIGSVFYAFLKDFNEKEDLIELDPSLAVEKQIAKLLQPGDVLIDNAPFFSGKKGVEIVQGLAKYSSLGTYRYLDEEDDVSIFHQEKISKGEAGIDLNTVISVIPHKGRQGTNWVFAKGKKGIVEVGMKTELTSFYQSVMRLRMLGKGQKAQVLFDNGLKQQWNLNPLLKDKSSLTKLIWTLIDNENIFLKNLHYQTNRKQIRSLRKGVIDQIKQSITNLDALLCIKEISEFKLIEQVPLDLEKCGHPILLEKPEKALTDLITSEFSHLATLRKKINDLEIDRSIKNQCLTIIDNSLNLKREDLLMSPRDLPESVPANQDLLSDAIEEIEVAVDHEVSASHQQEQEQHVSLEVENELSIEQEKETENEKAKIVKHPLSEEGREYTERSLCGWGWWEERNFIDLDLFPKISISNYALGILDDGRDASNLDMRKKRNSRLWMEGFTENKLPISSKVMIIISPAGDLKCQMGSVKDTDFGFYTPLSEKEIARNWKALSFEEAQKEKDLIPEQLKAVQVSLDPRYGSSYYDGKNSFYTDLNKWQFFKVDLNETKIPTSLDKSHHEKWIQAVALAKFLFVEASFNESEKKFLKQWLKGSKLPLIKLESYLKNYLDKSYPNAQRNELLLILREMNAEIV